MAKKIEDPTQIRKIVESPEADAPRRAYAQWLRQHGHSFDSEFIDVQLDLAETLRRHARVAEWAPLSDRSNEMLQIGRFGWTASLHDLIDAEQISAPVWLTSTPCTRQRQLHRPIDLF